mmetsp:Transcript_25506/g.46112  ORF Transcript_25506/g.46112 Transcript_25506/m.46112 type:complete len:89 (-) Transcript_25506:1120-1386(-)
MLSGGRLQTQHNAPCPPSPQHPAKTCPPAVCGRLQDPPTSLPQPFEASALRIHSRQLFRNTLQFLLRLLFGLLSVTATPSQSSTPWGR